MKPDQNELIMKKALRLAAKAARNGEVPVGALVIDPEGNIIGRGWNRRQEKQNVIEHAELMALQSACRKLHSWRLEDCSLYVTLEPCVMCSGAIIQSRIAHVYYGASDPKAGAVESVTRLFDVREWNHHPLYTGGILEEECSQILKDFFRERRRQNKLRKAQKKQEASQSDPALTHSRSGAEEHEQTACACTCCKRPEDGIPVLMYAGTHSQDTEKNKPDAQGLADARLMDEAQTSKKGEV